MAGVTESLTFLIIESNEEVPVTFDFKRSNMKSSE